MSRTRAKTKKNACRSRKTFLQTPSGHDRNTLSPTANTFNSPRTKDPVSYDKKVLFADTFDLNAVVTFKVRDDMEKFVDRAAEIMVKKMLEILKKDGQEFK